MSHIHLDLIEKKGRAISILFLSKKKKKAPSIIIQKPIKQKQKQNSRIKTSNGSAVPN